MKTPTPSPILSIQQDSLPIGENSSKKRKPNQDYRQREFLTPQEVDVLQKAASAIARSEASRVRNALMVRMMFLHALRASECSAMEWSQIDFANRRVYVNRVKNGMSSTHPLLEDELRMLGKLKKLNTNSKYIFLSEEGFSISPKGIHYIIKKAGEKASFDFPIHPHMLRHACGYYLAEKGTDTRTIQDYMGHKDIKCTVIYTQGTAKRFENLFQ